MAGTIKGITIEFSADTKKLDKELNNIKRETKGIDTELRDVNNALKFNPKNTELLAQKQQLLGDRIDATARNLDALKRKQAALDDDPAVDKTSQEYMALQRQIITTDSKLKHFNAELKKTSIESRKLYRVGAAFKDVGGKIENAGQKLRGLSTAAGVAAAGLGAVTYKAGKTADELNTLSKVTGISTGDLQMYAAAADLLDVSVDDMAKAHQRLKKAMISSSSEKYFRQLGIETRNADGSLRDVNDVFDETIDALGKMENETERDAVAMALMGKSATNLNPLIEDGGETYKKVSQMMKKYGLEPVSQEQLDMANEFNDAIDTIKLVFLQTVQIVGTKIAAYLVPIMDKLTQKIAAFAQLFTGLSGETLAKLGAILTAVALLSPALMILGKIISGIGTAMQTVVKIASGLSKALAFMAANPIVLLIAAIAALVAAFVVLWNKSEKFRTFFLNLWDSIKKKVQTVVAAFKTARDAIVNTWKNLPETFRKIWNNIGTGLKNLGTKMGNAVTGAIKSGINGVIQTVENIINKAIALINSAIRLANKLPGVNVGYVDKLNLPRLAAGGIVDSATLAIIGEGRQPEAVTPLDWLEKHIEKLAGKGDAAPTVINVYGAPGQDVNELADIVMRRLIDNEKRRASAWA